MNAEGRPMDAAALKVYRSYRTRRQLADSAVVAKVLWWQAIDFVRLNHNTISFFNYSKPEAPAAKWSRVSGNASKQERELYEYSPRNRKIIHVKSGELLDTTIGQGHPRAKWIFVMCTNKKLYAGVPLLLCLGSNGTLRRTKDV